MLVYIVNVKRGGPGCALVSLPYLAHIAPPRHRLLICSTPKNHNIKHLQIMATTDTWDYSIYNVSGLSQEDAWKKLRDLPFPPISDQLATYFQQRAAQSAHFEDVETLIANNHDDDDSSDDGHEPASCAKTGLLSPSLSPSFDAPATSVNENKDTLHNPEPISTWTSHPSLHDWPTSPEPISKSLQSLKSRRRLRRRSSAMTTRSCSTTHTSFFALNSKGKPESAREL